MQSLFAHIRTHSYTHVQAHVFNVSYTFTKNKLIATTTSTAKATAEMFPIKIYKNSNARTRKKSEECEKYTTIEWTRMNTNAHFRHKLCTYMQNEEWE